jgi:3-dehydroquinate synthase
VLTSLGLPTSYRGAPWAQLQEAMLVDKKARGSTLRFIVLERVGAPIFLDGPDPVQLLGAFDAISS